ncbi:MAG: site-specific integrase, partial [Weissella cibaria]
MDTATLTGLFLDYLRVERQYSEDTQKAYQSDITEFVGFLTDSGDSKPVDLTTIDQYDARVFLSMRYEKGDVSRTIARKVSSL